MYYRTTMWFYTGSVTNSVLCMSFTLGIYFVHVNISLIAPRGTWDVCFQVVCVCVVAAVEDNVSVSLQSDNNLQYLFKQVCGDRFKLTGNHVWQWFDLICVSELKDEVVYYDVCEDPEELHSMVHTGVHPAEPAAVAQLRRRLQTLETKRGNICARRAYLRNKKVQKTCSSLTF